MLLILLVQVGYAVITIFCSQAIEVCLVDALRDSFLKDLPRG